jgi:ABC-2 type transport system permease protein
LSSPVTDSAPQLREVRGPSALGGGWRRTLELLYLIASTEFKRSYFGTVLGYVWSVGRPLLLFAVLLEVFTHLIRFKDIPHYPVLLLMNIVLFGVFSEATSAAVGSVVNQEAIVRKTQFPRLVIPLAVVLTSCFNLGLNLVVTIIFMLAFGVTPMVTWLLLPFLLVLLLGLTTAVSMILSSLYPRYRDIGIIWTVFVTALFYATPIIYPLQKLEGHHTLFTLVSFNPLTPILELARRWMIDPNAPVAHGPAQIVVPIAIYVIVCVLGVRIFRRQAPRIAEEL